MSLNDVARFRVTTEEKAKLRRRADELGMDLSTYLRDVAGLPPASAVETSQSPAKATPAKKAPAKKESKKKDSKPSSEAPKETGPGEKAIEDLAFRIHNREGKTMKVARTEARKILIGGG